MRISTWKKAKRRSGRGTILIIALLLVGSAVARLATGSGFAVAQAISNEVMGETETQSAAPAQSDTATPGSPRISRPELGRLLTELQNREARVAERERQIEMRSKALIVADTEIEKRLVALEQIEADLRRTLALADGAAEDDLARLTAVYENMKPKEAAALFEAMEPDFAAGFLGRMRPDTAAAVMAGLTPETAYTISVILAGRNATVPKT